MTQRRNDLVLTIHCKPNAKKDAVVRCDRSEKSATVSVTAPAHEGKANARTVAFLAKKLGVSKSSVQIIRGEKSRIKHVTVAGMGQNDAFEHLESSMHTR